MKINVASFLKITNLMSLIELINSWSSTLKLLLFALFIPQGNMRLTNQLHGSSMENTRRQNIMAGNIVRGLQVKNLRSFFSIES